jgi:acylphosphatase
MLDKYQQLKYKDFFPEMELNMLTWQLTAHGYVQGVGFRRFAQKCAWRCGISGYARNQYDGSVSIRATGSREALDLYCDLLRAGTRFIEVRQLEITELEETVEYDDFEIR